MAVLKTDSYDWRTYAAKDAYRLTSARHQEARLLKGQAFGLRKAGSKKDVYRLILKALGPSTVFSLSQAEVSSLLKKSRPKSDDAARADPQAKRLQARLGRIDPTDFWAVVAALNWPKFGNDPDYADTARSALRECYRLQDVKRLARTAAGKRRELQKAVEKLERAARSQLFLGGDDSFYDTLALAVGSGKVRFEAFVRRPESFVKKFNTTRVEQHNFESCFD